MGSDLMTTFKTTVNQTILISFALLVAGCVTVPTGPSVAVLPAPGKPFDTFRAEDATCRQWAQHQLGGRSPQDSYNLNVATGAVAGTAIGAGLGAAIGSASGNAGEGALIGAAGGLLVGSSAGASAGQVSGSAAQRQYDNAYIQCMYSYGNRVPGYGMRTAQAYPPPPPDAGPPPVSLEQSPEFLYSPELSVYVAAGVPYDLVYTGSAYFYFYGGRWYRGPYYNGPWVVVRVGSLPPPLARHRIGQIRYYRNVEFKRYEHDRAHYEGRIHRPEFRGHKREAERREERR
jgi:hypothetical protein